MSRHLAVLIASVALVAAGCGSSSDDESSATPAATASATPTVDLSNGCRPADKPAPKAPGKIKKPAEKLDKGKTYVATVSTNCGDFEITLDAKRAPKTGGSFKYLADRKFFDGTTFHRIVKDFVIQGGDPAGTGEGGPGYTVVEAAPSSLRYTKGVVAMAKTGTDPQGASGSQFFVVTGAGAAQLPPDYALLGKVTSGMDVVEKINGIQADPSTGQPAVTVLIESITVKAS
ncbi:peptidylprolyl isomerase [Candidatus Solirubrobacter pratensis]|uniref:peptidylprolyl isomerase n=1 Tax=Candidatus Solirubrobacter pratensis TaxID=1298857 RepID=UPI0003F6246A|nr:peptidylprolyl isomerase [Candidatus Solirubrobacter pratensis]